MGRSSVARGKLHRWWTIVVVALVLSATPAGAIPQRPPDPPDPEPVPGSEWYGTLTRDIDLKFRDVDDAIKRDRVHDSVFSSQALDDGWSAFFSDYVHDSYLDNGTGWCYEDPAFPYEAPTYYSEVAEASFVGDGLLSAVVGLDGQHRPAAFISALGPSHDQTTSVEGMDACGRISTGSSTYGSGGFDASPGHIAACLPELQLATVTVQAFSGSCSNATTEDHQGTATTTTTTSWTWRFRRAECDTTIDSDGDDLADCTEFVLGTDPSNPDTDGDGLSDGAEVLSIGTDPNNPDTDGDGVADGADGCPLTPGTGSQGCPGPTPTPTPTLTPSPTPSPTPDPCESSPDSDGDGLTDCREDLLATSPSNRDTDADFLSDGMEVNQLGTNPLDRDTDNGAVRDDREVLVARTNPLLGDDDISMPYATYWRGLVDMAAKDYQVAKDQGAATKAYYRQVLYFLCSAGGVSKARPAGKVAMKLCPAMADAVGPTYGEWAGDFPKEVFGSFLPTIGPTEIAETNRKVKTFARALCEMAVRKAPLVGRACMSQMDELGFAFAGTVHAAHELAPNFVRHARHIIKSAQGGTTLQMAILSGNMAVMRDQHRLLFSEAVEPGFRANGEINGVFKWIAKKFVPFAASCEREVAIRKAMRDVLGKDSGDVIFAATDQFNDGKIADTHRCKFWVRTTHFL